MAPPVERLSTSERMGGSLGALGGVPVDLSFHTKLCTLYRTMARSALSAPLVTVTVPSTRLL